MALVKKAGQLTLAATPTRRGTISRLSFAVPAGPVYEDAWTSGLSHLLRRVAYRDNFLASGWRSEFDITNAGLFTGSELEGWKAGLVGRQFVTYSITGPTETVLQTSVVDKLAQMVFFPRFHPRDVEEVSAFIQKDVKKPKIGNPAYYVKELLFQVAFKGSPHGNSAYMPDYNLKWAGNQQLWDLWEKNFRHDSIKIVGSNVDLDKLNSIIEESQVLADAHVKQSTNPLTAKELTSKYVGGNASYIHRREQDYDPDYVNTADSWSGVAFKGPSVNNRKEWLAGWIAKGALDSAFGYVDFYGNSPKAAAYYDPMDGAGLLSVVFTNYNGNGDAVEKRVEDVKAALTSATESDAKFEAARKSAIVQLSKRLSCSNDSVDEAILSLWARNEAPTIAELVKDLNAISRADFTAQVKKIVESNPTTVFYGGSPLSK